MKHQQKLRKILQSVNISDKAIQIYEELVTFGGMNVAQIAKSVTLNRTNSYRYINELLHASLIRKGHRARKKVFLAHPPSTLLKIFKDHQKMLTLSERELENLLPELEKEYSVSHESIGVYRFEGLEGLKKVYLELLKDRVTVNSIVNRKSLRNFIGDFNEYYIKERIRKGIRSRVITPSTSEKNSIDHSEMREVRTIPEELFPFNMDVKVTEKKVLLTTFEKDTAAGIIIIDEAISKNFEILFEYLWRSSTHTTKR